MPDMSAHRSSVLRMDRARALRDARVHASTMSTVKPEYSGSSSSSNSYNLASVGSTPGSQSIWPVVISDDPKSPETVSDIPSAEFTK